MKTLYIATRTILIFVLAVLCMVSVNSQTFQWAKVGGEPGGAVGNNIAVDAQGNSYVTGYFLSTADFDGITVNSNGGQDIYVAKYNTNGVIQWVLKAGGIGDDAGNDISLDASGNIYITGKFRDTATFGSFTLISSGNTDVFVAKCSPSGQWLWAIKGSGIGDEEGTAICTDVSGNSYITGYFSDSPVFGSTTINTYGVYDILIAKCNSNGMWIWASHAGGGSWDFGNGISVDNNGNIYITGYFSDFWGYPVYFGSNVLYATAGTNMFVAKYDSAGNNIWAVKGGGPGHANGADIATDADGNSYVLGIFYDTASFNGVTLIAVAPEGSWWNDDYFFAKYDSDGNLKWIYQLGGAGYFKGNGVTLGTEGEVFITGTFDGTVAIIDTTLTSSGYDNMYVALFDTAGAFYWVKKADGNYYHATMGISDGTGNAYITGFFGGTATFNCTTFTAGWFGNMFITKLNDFIHTGNIAQSGFCPGETVMVPFTSKKPCNPQNVYTAQLSDITGCFNNPVNIGTLNDYGTSGVITAAIPQNTTNDTTYRIRVISSDPLIIGADNGINLTIYPLPVAEAGNDTIVDNRECVTLGNYPINNYTYSWTPGKGISDSTIANPVAILNKTTKFYLKVTNNYQCETKDSVTITVTSNGRMKTICSLDSLLLKNSEGNLNLINNISDCGLNYTSGNVRLAMRCWDPNNPGVPYFPGTPQPAAINIAGIPNGAVIEQAYIYWMIENAHVPGGSGTVSSVILKNPNPSTLTHTIQGNLIGSNIFGCWGFGVASFRADITTVLDLPYNGTYYISGLPTSSSLVGVDTEGATLIIIYKDPATNIVGTLVLYDGLITERSLPMVPLNVQLSGFNATNVTGNAQAFVQLGDFQGVNNNATISLNGNTPTTFNQDFWDYEEQNTLVTNGQTTSDFTIDQINDCVHWIFAGLYFQSSIFVNVNQTNVGCNGQNNGAAEAVASGGTVPYTYDWNTIPPQNSSIATNLSAGTYTVTVTDANGCSATDDITVTVNPLPTANAGADVTICLGGSTQLNATGGVSYLWSPATGLICPTCSTTVASPATTTTYTVTVTDANGCTASDDITIEVIPAFASSAFIVTDLCQPEVTFESTTSDPNTTYNWDVNNDGIFENTVSSPVFTYSYSQPGFYLVTLNVTNQCTPPNTVYSSQLIQVIPSTQTYNIGCCSEDPNIINYDVPGSYTVPPTPSNPVWTSVGGANPWGITGHVIIKEKMIIPAGVNLTINQMYFEFGPNGKLIIEPGATLTVFNCTFDGLRECHTMWQGIEVWGNSSKTHSLADQIYQGKFTATGETFINNAHNGILVGRTRICINNYYYPTIVCKKGPYNLSFDGGIIDLSQGATYFNSDAVGIKFLPFTPKNASIITGDFFNGGTLLDPGYNLSNPTYTYTNPLNPYYASANSLGRSVSGIYMWGLKNMTLNDINGGSGNTFTNMENGIYSIDAGYTIMDNHFNTITNGIAAYNVVSSALKRHVIIRNDFNIFSTAAIYIEAGKNDLVYNNQIGDPSLTMPQSLNNNGILIKTSNFEISDNNFYNLLTGIFVENSGTGGGLISNRYLPENGNVFTQCKRSFYTSSNNLFLQNRCNQCVNPAPTYYTRNWEICGNLANQGRYNVNDMYNVKNPAGNEFSSPFYKEIKSNNFGFTYYRHLDASKTPITPNTLITIFPNPVWFDHINSCKRKIANPLAIAELKNKINTLSDEYINVYNNLDKGNTTALLNAINGNTSAGQLKNLLINNSPLSDEVLINFINLTNPVPPGHFKDVMIPNSPVSDTVKPYLDVKLATLPPGIAKQIKDVQAVNPSYRTLTTIKNELNTTINERTLAINELTSRWIANDSASYAISLLENETTADACQALAAIYLADSNFAKAENKLDSLPLNSTELQDWKDLMDIVLNLAVNDNTVFEITAAQEQQIRYYAGLYPSSLVTSNAQAILRLIYGEEFPIIYPDGNLKLSSETGNETDTLNYLGNNIPNPFTNTTVIPYSLPADAETALLNIYNIQGQLLKTYTLQKGTDNIEISLKDYQSGIYLYGISIDGAMRQYKRMVLIK